MLSKYLNSGRMSKRKNVVLRELIGEMCILDFGKDGDVLGADLVSLPLVLEVFPKSALKLFCNLSIFPLL